MSKLEEFVEEKVKNYAIPDAAGEVYIREKGVSESDLRELGKTHVVLSKELVGFLLGENDYQGKYMGDEPPVIAGKYKARYWWRKLIRSEIQASE